MQRFSFFLASSLLVAGQAENWESQLSAYRFSLYPHFQLAAFKFRAFLISLLRLSIFVFLQLVVCYLGQGEIAGGPGTLSADFQLSSHLQSCASLPLSAMLGISECSTSWALLMGGLPSLWASSPGSLFCSYLPFHQLNSLPGLI